MDRERAKHILLAYRPGTLDREDSDVSEALEFARRDPALQRWLEEQTAFQRSVRQQLRQMPVPAGLKDSILAGRKIVTPIWKRPEFLLAAACVAMAFILTALWAKPSRDTESFAGFRSRMVSYTRVYRMDIVTNDLAQVRDYLRQTGAPADIQLTPALAKTPVKGGAKLMWQGNPVSMVCFGLPPNNRTIYMFVMNQTAVRQGPKPGNSPVLATVNGIQTASWSRGGKIYLIAAEGNSAAFKQLLGGRNAPQGSRSTAFTSLISQAPWLLRKTIRNA